MTEPAFAPQGEMSVSLPAPRCPKCKQPMVKKKLKGSTFVSSTKWVCNNSVCPDYYRR